MIDASMMFFLHHLKYLDRMYDDKYFQFSKSWPSNIYILPIVLFSVVYNLPKFLEFQVITEVKTPGLSNFTSPSPTDLNLNGMNNYTGEEVLMKVVFVLFKCNA